MTPLGDELELAAARHALSRHSVSFERYARLARNTTGAPIALITSNGSDRASDEMTAHCVTGTAASAIDIGTSGLARQAARISEARSPVGFSELDEGAVRAAAGSPIRIAGGAAVGALVVLDTTTREWSDTELRSLGDLGDAIGVELELMELSARLEEDRHTEQQKRVAADRLKGVSFQLATATTVHEVIGTVLERVVDLHLSDVTVIGLLDDDGGHLRLEHGSTMPRWVLEDWQTAPLDAELPLSVATRTGVPLVLGHPAEIEQWPEFAAAAQRLELRSFAAYPLTTDSGDVIGSLGVGHRGDTEIDDAAMRQVADITGVALHRVARSNTEREHARILQKALLPAHQPVIPGLETAWACYPAGDDVHVGGDWYDVLPLGERVCLVVGDVAGHDLRAARTMARARHSLAAYLYAGDSGAEALARCGRVLGAVTPPAFATCCVIELHARGRATVASAGHLPPIVIRASGDASTIPTNPGPPMGTFDASIDSTSFELGNGDIVVMYTDGIVESKDEPLDVSIERLVGTLQGFGGTAKELTEVLASQAQRSTDDASVLAARRQE